MELKRVYRGKKATNTRAVWVRKRYTSSRAKGYHSALYRRNQAKSNKIILDQAKEARRSRTEAGIAAGFASVLALHPATRRGAVKLIKGTPGALSRGFFRGVEHGRWIIPRAARDNAITIATKASQKVTDLTQMAGNKIVDAGRLALHRGVAKLDLTNRWQKGHRSVINSIRRQTGKPELSVREYQKSRFGQDFTNVYTNPTRTLPQIRYYEGAQGFSTPTQIDYKVRTSIALRAHELVSTIPLAQLASVKRALSSLSQTSRDLQQRATTLALRGTPANSPWNLLKKHEIKRYQFLQQHADDPSIGLALSNFEKQIATTRI